MLHLAFEAGLTAVLLVTVTLLWRRGRWAAGLQAGEERLRLTLEAVGAGTWDWNIPAGGGACSDHWFKLLGYEASEFRPDQAFWESLIHPDDKPGFMAAVTGHLEGRTESFELEYRLRSKSSGYHWILDRGKVVERDATGRPLRMLGTFIDITQRKQAELALHDANASLERRVLDRTASLRQANTDLTAEIAERAQVEQALRDSEMRLAEAQRIGQTGSWVRDLRTGVVQATDEFHRILGLPLNAPTSFDAIVERIHHDDIGLFQATIAAGQSERRGFSMAFRAVLPDGTVRVLRSIGQYEFDDAGEAIRTTGIVQDITQMKDVEGALEAERTMLKTLMDAWPDFVYVKDRNSRFIKANAATAEIMGVGAADELVDRTDFDFYPPDIAAQFHDSEQAMIASGRPVVSREELLRRDDRQLWLSTTKIPYRDADGRIAGFVGIGRDMTERKRTEQELGAAKEQAEFANHAKSQFLAAMSH